MPLSTKPPAPAPVVMVGCVRPGSTGACAATAR